MALREKSFNPFAAPQDRVNHRSPSMTPTFPPSILSDLDSLSLSFSTTTFNNDLRRPSNSHSSIHSNELPPLQHIILHTNPRRSSFSKIGNGSGSSSEQPARLTYTTSFNVPMNFILVQSETTLGRKDSNDIVLSCAKISKFHASIMNDEIGFWLRDRNSSNGVRVNGSLMDAEHPFFLSEGDEIEIGTIILFFHEPFNSQSLLSNEPPTEKDIEKEKLKLVTILPSEKKYEETFNIKAEIEAGEEPDFKKIQDVESQDVLREDYEKLRLAYELSKISLTHDISGLLDKTLEMIFEFLPVDRGVVLLVDSSTGFLATHHVKLRFGKGNENREILLSSTILKRVYYSRTCLVTSDACEDPILSGSSSVKNGQIRSVLCVPLMSHNKVHGIMHLDSRDKSSFSNKDIALVKTISNQTAMAIENTILLKAVEEKAKMTENLRRFLAPQVVEKMMSRHETMNRGGREIVGTIVFADIRGFTKLSENCAPAEVVALLNDFFERLVKIVFKYEGIIDKYIGDALMAVFGTLEDEKDSEWRSVAASLEFVSAITDMNEERKRLGRDPIHIGVGINTGPLVAGFIGCSQRLEYTCIGDTVNTSSRICGFAGVDQVLMSERTYNAVHEKVEAKLVGPRSFKGKSKEVVCYEAVRLTQSLSTKAPLRIVGGDSTLKTFK